jgi:hypothetical protein
MTSAPLPEIRTILERAWARRESLLALIATVPADYWARRAGDDAWTARNHLEHLATIDDVVVPLLKSPAPVLDEALLAARESVMQAVAGMEVVDLVQRLEASRRDLVGTVARLGLEALGREIRLPARDAWSPPGAISVRAYLAQWAEHDALHEGAIRRAIANQPGPGDLARAAVRRRQADVKEALAVIDTISGYTDTGGRRFTRDEMNER